jgi:serine/threonine-protein kinase
MASDLQNGTQLGHYRIERIVGRGGMGVVYLARDLGLDRYVALKILAPELAENATFRERFIRESRLAASLDHANIIPIYEADEVDGVLFIAMRYVQGRDLRMILAEEERLDPYRAIVQIGTQVARALDAAHVRGLVHRDVKPGNVLITTGEGTEGHCYLADFGLTRQTASLSGLTGAGQFVGTLSYIAPEQIQDHGVDGRSDQYSLAAVLFECLAGRPPFVKESDPAVIYAHLEEPPPPLSAIGWGLPQELDGVFERALAKEKQDRFDTCAALIAAAREAAGFGPPSGAYLVPERPLGDRTTVTAERPPGGRTPSRPGRPGTAPPGGPGTTSPSGTWRRKSAARSPATWWTVAVAALVVVALALFLFKGGSSPGPEHGAARGNALYLFETNVGVGGSPGVLKKIQPIGSALGPGWNPNTTEDFALLEHRASTWYVDVGQSKGNRPKILKHLRVPTHGSLSHLTWSTDGVHLAYVRTEQSTPEIDEMSRGGSNRMTLSAMLLGSRDPAYAPDGGVLAFEGSNGGPFQIYSMGPQGKNPPKRLTDLDGDCSDPTWRSDGRLIAFLSKVGPVNQVFVMSRNGARIRKLTQARLGLADPVWSRDGTRVAYVQNVTGAPGATRLAVVGLKDRRVKFLTDPYTDMVDPMWAPSGDIMYFVASRDGVPQLYELRLGSGSVDSVTNLPGGVYQPSMSADGSHLLFITHPAPAASPTAPAST